MFAKAQCGGHCHAVQRMRTVVDAKWLHLQVAWGTDWGCREERAGTQQRPPRMVSCLNRCTKSYILLVLRLAFVWHMSTNRGRVGRGLYGSLGLYDCMRFRSRRRSCWL